MKKNQFAFLIIILLSSLVSCSVVQDVSGNRLYHLIVANPTNIERSDELVVLRRELIEQKTGKIGEGRFISITSPDKQPVQVQFDDLNNDKLWDEAVFLYTFKPNETADFKIQKTKKNATKGNVRAHVRMLKKNANNTFGASVDTVSISGGTIPTDFAKQKLPLYLTEGPAWENDKVGFGLYFDARNTKNVYGKQTTKMVMDSVGIDPANNYHKLADWGMDVLAVGKSLGAGSIALSFPSNGKDTLVRLGGNNIERVTFERISDGPLRAMFRMYYINWKLANNQAPVNVVEEISIWGGKYYYQSKVSIENAPVGARLVTGIVNLKSKKSNRLNTANTAVLYTYDNQSENKDLLGLAVMVKNKYFSSFNQTPNERSEIQNTYTVLMPIEKPYTEFRFFAGWERSDLLFTREENFRRYLEAEALKYDDQITISWHDVKL